MFVLLIIYEIQKKQNGAANKLYVDIKLQNSITKPGCWDFKNNMLIKIIKY